MIFRIHKHGSGFTQIDNRALEDERLSFKAKGLLAYLLSRPVDWRIDSTAMADSGPDGRDAIRSGLAELAEHGYLRYEKQQDERGRWVTISHIYESPSDAENPQPEPEKPSPVRPAETDEPAGHTEDGLSDVGKSGAKELRRKNQDETFSHAASQRAPWGEFESVKAEIETIAAGAPPRVAERLRSQLLDLGFWRTIDALTTGTKVFYDHQLREYIAWLLTKPPSSQHKNLRKGFTAWIREAIRRDQRRRAS